MKRVSLRFIGIIIAPAIIVAFLLGFFLAGTTIWGERVANSKSDPQTKTIKAVTTQATENIEESPFAKVASKVIPAVVNISTEKKITIKTPGFEFEWPFEDLFRDFFKNLPQPEPLQRKTHTLGSGVIVDPRGYILTNNHVIGSYDKIVVKLSDNREFTSSKVKLIGRDKKTDLAVLKIEADEPLPYAEMGNSDEIKIGDWAIAIGNPFGLEGTVTVGVISAKGRSGIPLPEGPSYQDFIQTDASINPGNSGGPLVNIKGEVIGINTAIRSPVGANVGIGFATPINLAKRIFEELVEKGKVVRGYLGVAPQEVTEDIREAMGLAESGGVLIRDVVAGTPAEKVGLKPGDVITKFDGKKITGVEQFRRIVAETKPGTTVKIEFIRDSERRTIEVKLAEYPEEVAATEVEKAEEKHWLGIIVRDLKPSEQKELGLKQGVLVEEIKEDSPAAEAGIQEGDVIIKINREPVNDTKDFNRIARRLAKSQKPILFQLKREKSTYFITVRPD
ncbi:MAG: DegQ family serine endoprotease [candidate division WOR-3 bacterium]